MTSLNDKRPAAQAVPSLSASASALTVQVTSARAHSVGGADAMPRDQTCRPAGVMDGR